MQVGIFRHELVQELHLILARMIASSERARICDTDLDEHDEASRRLFCLKVVHLNAG